MDDNDIENLLNSDDDISPVVELESRQAEEICGVMGDVKPLPQILDDLPELMGEDYTSNFLRMSNRILAQYKVLPKLNHEAIYEELAILTVKSIPTPTLQQINRELQKVQAVKERLSEIIAQIIPSHTIKKRSVDILKDSWIRFSQEKSADKRKADSVYRMSAFEGDYLAVDALLRTAMHIAKNLDSLQDILSRRITIMSLQLKMADLGRHSFPDHDFGKESLESNEFDALSNPSGEESTESPSEVSEAEELSF
jgi:hypothetical protein